MPPVLHAHAVQSVEWPRGLDVELALRVMRGEPAHRARIDLVSAAADAATAFFADKDTLALLDLRFDIALVDAGCLASHLLVDALYPLPHVHFLTYPYRPPPSIKAHMLEASAVQKCIGPRLQGLRASLGVPPKQECALLHVRTLVGHSRALHGTWADSLPASMCCVGSVRSSAPYAALAEELCAWADDAAGGFVVISLGSWADEVCTALGRDTVLAEALGMVGKPCIWKTRGAFLQAGSAGGEDSEGSASEGCVRSDLVDQRAAGARDASCPLPANVRTSSWLPQRALLEHPNCALLVCHGGANSISEACEQGVGIVGLACAWDQTSNVELLQALGIGRAVELASCTASCLSDTMCQVMSDAGRAERAAALAATMQREDTGALGAARVVETAYAAYAEVRAAHDVSLRTSPSGEGGSG